MVDVLPEGIGRSVPPPTVVVPPSAGERSEDLPQRGTQQPANSDFGDLLRLLWRRKRLLIAFVVVAIALCAVLITQVTPAYTARGLVLVGAPSTKIVDLEAVLSGVS